MTVLHQPANRRFVIELPEGEAVLDYVLAPDRVMNILTTEVPATARGHGIGGHLVRAALDHARGENLQVIPSCWFVRTWVRENSEYRDLLITD